MGLSPAADGIPIHSNLRRTVEGILRRGHAAVQGGTGRKYFEGGTGLIHIGDGCDAHEIRQGLHIVPGRFIGIIVWAHAHSQNGPCLNVANQAERALRLVDLHAFPHDLFADLLEGSVNGKLQGGTRAGSGIVAFAAGQGAVSGVHLMQIGACHAGQHRVVTGFQPRLPYAVHVG